MRISYDDVIDKTQLAPEDYTQLNWHFQQQQSSTGKLFLVDWGFENHQYHSQSLSNRAIQQRDFVHFINPNAYAKIKNHWKIHISVGVNDLPNAWDLLLPILLEEAYVFKVIKLSKLNQAIEQINNVLQMSDDIRLQESMIQYKAQCNLCLRTLKAELAQLSGNSQAKKSLEATIAKLELADQQAEQIVTSQFQSNTELETIKKTKLRLRDGLQITVYIA